MKKWQLAIVCGIGGIVVCALLFNFFSQVATTTQQSWWKNDQQKRKEAQRREYAELSSKHALTTPRDVVDLAAEETVHQLVGEQKIHIVLVKPPNISLTSVQPLVHALTSQDSSSKSSLAYINTYLQQQARYYAPQSFNVSVNVTELYTIDSVTYVGDIGNPWEKDSFGITKLQDDFEKIRSDHGISATEPVMFLYFDPFAANDAGEKRFYDNQEFRSFADENQKRAYINVYSLSTDFAPTVNEIIIHELLHLYGATDKYLENVRGCAEDGWLGLPHPYSMTPAEQTDIMCGYIKNSAGTLRSAQFAQDELIINTKTAAEIGWQQKSPQW